MNRTVRPVLAGWLTLMTACSSTTPPADGAVDAPPAIDTASPGVDATPDVALDAATDATPDAATDAATDALDAALDAAPDAFDATTDAAPDRVDDRPADAPDSGDVPVALDVAVDVAVDVALDAAPVNPLAGRGDVERVRSGLMFVEGPQWRSREGDLLFSDIPANTIFRLDGADAITAFRTPSDNSNGLAVDAAGRLLAAEHGSRSVTRARPDGSRETLASHFIDGARRLRLNSPNDLVARSDGTVYFTDPPYGIAAAQQELSFNGVFRVSPSGALTAEWRGATSARPNGVALSPDERVLYVTDTADGAVRAWDVQPDGALARERTLARTSGSPDGMAVDRAGNLYVATGTGVQAFSAAGRAWGTIATPEQPANCAFGGADARTLYVTARTGLYRVRLAAPGLY